MRITDTTRIAYASRLMVELGVGARMRLYDGSRPELVEDAHENNQLAVVTFKEFTVDAELEPGVVTFATPAVDEDTTATGTPTWGTIESPGGTLLADFEVPDDLAIGGLVIRDGQEDLIEKGGVLTITSLSFTVPAEC